MHDRIVVIDHRSVEWHEAFLRYVPRIFRRASFRKWYELCGWDSGYRAFAFVDGDEIVANVSVQQMNILIDGAPCRGWQIGAVGVLPDLRGRGLQRRLMDHVLEQFAADDFVFLFANEDVLNFYPRFGFRREQEWIFSVDVSPLPQPGRLRQLSVDSAEDRALLANVAQRARPVTEVFGASRYGNVICWYWTNAFGYEAYYNEVDGAIVFVERDENVLRICDVLAESEVDLASYVPQLIAEPIQCIELGFTPDRYFREAKPEFEYLESPLFVRSPRPLPTRAFKFPVLAQT